MVQQDLFDERTQSERRLWFERGNNGELIPMYSDRETESKAMNAFLDGRLGELTLAEVKFYRSVATAAHIRVTN